MATVTEKYVGQNKPAQDYKVKWWLEKPETFYQHVFQIVNNIQMNQNYRRLNNIKYARLYQNMEVLGFYGSLYSRSANAPVTNNRLTLNVVKSCVDTASAKTAKMKPKPLFLTNGGQWHQQKKAKQLTKYIEGLFYKMDLYSEAQKQFVDAGVMGTGALKFYKKDGQVCAERVLIDEIIVDDAEGTYMKPQTLYQSKYVHREILCEAFPKYEQEIYNADSGISGDVYSTSSADLVKVNEAWHLSKETGQTCIAISNCTLHHEEWKKDYFPFTFYRWCPRIVGFYGTGIAEELLGIQLEINKALRNVQLAMHLNAVPRWLVENNSMVNTAHISNEISSIIKYTGTAPEAFVAPAMSPEAYQYIENLYRKAFEIVGISQLSAMAKKPDGLDAGVALREMNDIESERFVLQGQRWENQFLEASKICIDLSRDLYEEDKDLSVNVKGKRFIETIKWKDVDLEDDAYFMQAWPVSLLPSTPAGRLQKIQELTQAGFISQDQAKALLDFPDLEQYMNVANSSIEDINMIIDKMIEDGVYTSPEPYMNLEQCVSTTQSYYLFAKTQNVPEERLELLRQFMDDCQELQELARQGMAETMQQQGGLSPSGEPIATGEAPPVSDVLPFQQ